MLQNECLVAKIGVDRPENEPSKVSPKSPGVPKWQFPAPCAASIPPWPVRLAQPRPEEEFKRMVTCAAVPGSLAVGFCVGVYGVPNVSDRLRAVAAWLAKAAQNCTDNCFRGRKRRRSSSSSEEIRAPPQRPAVGPLPGRGTDAAQREAAFFSPEAGRAQAKAQAKAKAQAQAQASDQS